MDERDLPEARVRSRRRLPSVVWVLPLLAALVAGFLGYDRIKELGPSITILFKDGSGIRSGQTQIKYRGVPVGEVTSLGLSEDREHVLVHARLVRSAASIARQESVFWIVRPEVEIGSITGLTTVISGPEIHVLPGAGASQSEFVGLERAPVADGRGLRVILRAQNAASLRRNSPVYYRGVEVGLVQEVTLGRDASETDVHVLIRERYASLVREGSVFWNVSGAQMSAGLFKGVNIKMESLRSMIAGGIAFATPESAAATPVQDGAVFALHREAKREWLHWAPRIALDEERTDTATQKLAGVAAAPKAQRERSARSGGGDKKAKQFETISGERPRDVGF